VSDRAFSILWSDRGWWNERRSAMSEEKTHSFSILWSDRGWWN
jgi:hypothetical protein